MVSVIAGLVRPDAGRVRVGGFDVVESPREARGLLGLAPQDTGVYVTLSVCDNLRFFAGLAGLRGRARDVRIADVADALGLSPLMARRAAELSGGERRRLHTAIALVHEPAVVLLDEPTTGADVRTRAEILAAVRQLAEQGSAVLYSTHYLQEVVELDATIAIMDRGKVVARGQRQELLAAHASSALLLSFDGPVPAVARADGTQVDDETVRISTDDPAALAARLLPRLTREDASLRSLEVLAPTLEAVFLEVTGHPFADGVPGAVT